MIGEIIHLDAALGFGRVRAQGTARVYVFGFSDREHSELHPGDIVSFMPHRVGDTEIALAIRPEKGTESASSEHGS